MIGHRHRDETRTQQVTECGMFKWSVVEIGAHGQHDPHTVEWIDSQTRERFEEATPHLRVDRESEQLLELIHDQ